MCANKKVLHIGCADMPYTLQRGERLLHRQLAEVVAADQLWGVDCSREGVEALRGMGFEHLIEGDIETMGPQLRELGFGVVLFSEVIEHLSNPGQALAACRSVMTADSELLITTPNATSLRGFVNSLFRFEKVHPDHNYYFSYRTIRHLLEQNGLTCREVYYYQATEGKGAAWLVDQVLSLGARATPPWADGLIVRAVRRDASNPPPGH